MKLDIQELAERNKRIQDFKAEQILKNDLEHKEKVKFLKMQKELL